MPSAGGGVGLGWNMLNHVGVCDDEVGEVASASYLNICRDSVTPLFTLHSGGVVQGERKAGRRSGDNDCEGTTREVGARTPRT